MALPPEGTAKQNGTHTQLKAGRVLGAGGGDSRRGQSKRTMKYNQSVRDVKS